MLCVALGLHYVIAITLLLLRYCIYIIYCVISDCIEEAYGVYKRPAFSLLCNGDVSCDEVRSRQCRL